MKDDLILTDKSKIKDFVLQSEKLFHHCRMGWVESDNERWWSKPFDSYLLLTYSEGEEEQRENCIKTLKRLVYL